MKSKKREKTKINWKVLVISLIIVYAIAFIGSIFTSANTKTDWYESIRPALTPPNWVFPIVWNILFFMIALSLYFSWINTNKRERKTLSLMFGINLILNALWSYLYFTMKNPLLGFIDIILMILSTGIIILFSWKIDRKIAYLMMPYFLWICFASILNFMSIR